MGSYYLQFHLHKQLLDASRHAARQHVALKGDLPIGEITRYPAYIWLMMDLIALGVYLSVLMLLESLQ